MIGLRLDKDPKHDGERPIPVLSAIFTLAAYAFPLVHLCVANWHRPRAAGLC